MKHYVKGMLEHVEHVEYCNIGTTSEHWNIETLEHWNIGT